MKQTIYKILIFALSFGILNASSFKPTIDKWESHEDVANWLKNNWTFDKYIAKDMVKIIQTKGPGASSVKSAEDTFEDPRGWCKDSANFAKDTLNKVNSDYKAQYVFIENKVKKAPNHWVAGFKKDGYIYIIDYGAGSHWKQMMGVHGPYSSLDEYGEFLSSLNIDNFELDFVKWIPTGNKGSGNQMAKRRAIVVLGKFDKNGDDGISFAEAPGLMKKNFQRLDKNDDELLDEEELSYLPPR